MFSICSKLFSIFIFGILATATEQNYETKTKLRIPDANSPNCIKAHNVNDRTSRNRGKCSPKQSNLSKTNSAFLVVELDMISTTDRLGCARAVPEMLAVRYSALEKATHNSTSAATFTNSNQRYGVK